jgi:TatA/E family protein of Tat protein translocase
MLLIILTVLFGPSRLAGAGKAVSEAIRGFRQSVRDEEAAARDDEQRQE